MSESDIRAKFMAMIPELDPVPIENLITTQKGQPDVEYIGGYCEIKWKREWPARASTPLRLEHYTQEQRDWLLRRTLAGERCWLLLVVGPEWFFFDAEDAQEVGNLCYQDLVDTATHYFPKKPLPAEVLRILTLG